MMLCTIFLMALYHTSTVSGQGFMFLLTEAVINVSWQIVALIDVI